MATIKSSTFKPSESRRDPGPAAQVGSNQSVAGAASTQKPAPQRRTLFAQVTNASKSEAIESPEHGAPSAMAAKVDAQAAAAAPRPGNFLQVPESAATDIRKACNSIKRMAAIASIAAERSLDIAAVTDRAEAVTLEVLTALGYDTSDNERMSAAIPMVMEAVCMMMAAGVRAGDDPVTASQHIVPALVEVARCKLMSRAVEKAWPDDIDAVMAINIAAVNAMTPVNLEALEFDFFQPAGALMKEASRKLMATVQLAVEEQSPAGATQAAKLVFTQSLLQSGGRVLAAVWRQCADETIEQVNALPGDKRKVRVEQMKAASAQDTLALIFERFDEVFGAMVEAAGSVRVNASVAAPAPTRPSAAAATNASAPRSVLTRRVAGRA